MRRRRPTRVGQAGRWTAGLLVPALWLAGCATSPPIDLSFPVATFGPAATVSPAVALTRAALVRALAGHQLVLTDTQAPVRPVESPLLVAAPRAVYQVILPKDPDKGYIVVYEFPDANGAALAAAEEQRYLESGPGRVQMPQGSVQVLRQLGVTVILYDWLPGAAQDPSAPAVQQSLETVGVGFPISG